jgi:2-keto-4-pentenoate hydratase
VDFTSFTSCSISPFLFISRVCFYSAKKKRVRRGALQGPPAMMSRLTMSGAHFSSAASTGRTPAALFADKLLSAWIGNTEASDLPPLDSLADAMDVQRAMVESPFSSQLGGVSGWKLGWKGQVAEKHALYGPIFRSGMLQSGTEVSLGELVVHAAEAEFGMVLGRTLEPRDTPYSEAEVWDAVDHVELCIELPGARQYQSEEPLHYIADALLSCAIVRGKSIGKPVDPAQLATAEVRILVGGIEISTGTGEENPGDSPLASLTFLANELCVEQDVAIEAGQLVMCGHCCFAPFEGRPCPPFTKGKAPEAAWTDGDVLRAEFEGLGHVEAVVRE